MVLMQNQLEIYDAPEPGKDYILQIKIRNGPLLRAMRMRGFKTVAAFSVACGMKNATSIYRFLGLQQPPIGKRGEWSQTVLKMAEVLRLPPDSLFPEQHLQHALAVSSGEIEASAEDIASLAGPQPELNAEQLLDKLDTRNMVRAAMQKILSPREERVVRLRLGFDGEPKTFDEVGEALGGVSRERIRQIEAKAFRKLKQWGKLDKLVDFRTTWDTSSKTRTHMPPVADLEAPVDDDATADADTPTYTDTQSAADYTIDAIDADVALLHELAWYFPRRQGH